MNLIERTTDATLRLLEQAATLLEIPLPEVEIRFDLSGRAAGMVRYPTTGRPQIRYNLILLQENGEAFIATTVPHEVAHLAVWSRFGRRASPHGEEWKWMMQQLGAEPSRCHQFDTRRSSRRSVSRTTYHCDCREHLISRIRQNRMAAGQIYQCRRCGGSLRPGRKNEAT